jgi:hypothetical protein
MRKDRSGGARMGIISFIKGGVAELAIARPDSRAFGARRLCTYEAPAALTHEHAGI